MVALDGAIVAISVSVFPTANESAFLFKLTPVTAIGAGRTVTEKVFVKLVSPVLEMVAVSVTFCASAAGVITPVIPSTVITGLSEAQDIVEPFPAINYGSDNVVVT